MCTTVPKFSTKLEYSFTCFIRLSQSNIYFFFGWVYFCCFFFIVSNNLCLMNPCFVTFFCLILSCVNKGIQKGKFSSKWKMFLKRWKFKSKHRIDENLWSSSTIKENLPRRVTIIVKWRNTNKTIMTHFPTEKPNTFPLTTWQTK